MWHVQEAGHAKKAKSNGKKLRRRSVEVRSAFADEAEGETLPAELICKCHDAAPYPTWCSPPVLSHCAVSLPGMLFTAVYKALLRIGARSGTPAVDGESLWSGHHMQGFHM